MRRLLVVAALMAAAVSGGCGPSSYDDFRVQLAKRACDRAVRCGFLGASEAQHCAPPADIVAHTFEEPDVAVKNGRMRYFSDFAQDCLDAVNGAPCDDIALLYRVQQRCHHVLEPGAKQGQACYPGECEGGVCAGAVNGCMGTCVSYPPPGAACDPNDPFGCDPTVQWCDGACERKKPKGAACDTDVECVYGYYCVLNVCDDPPVLAPGDTCAVINRLCSDDLYCSSQNQCAPFVESGGACDVDVACKPGLACVGLSRMRPGTGPSATGTCQPWADLMQACTAAPVSGCPATQVCEGGVCLAGEAPPVMGVNQPCTADGDCADGLYCSVDTCRYRVGVGGDCSTSASACTGGLLCDPDTHICGLGNAPCGL